jgi:hypothetical protein
MLALKLAYKPALFAVQMLLIAASVGSGAWRRRGLPDPADPQPTGRAVQAAFALIFGAFTFLYFFNAWAPEMSPDGSGYHLGLVARYLRVHGFEQVTTNFYSGLSAGVEMLFVPAFAFGRHSAGALVHLSFAIALALAMLAYGKRIGKPWVGAAGALLTYASPVVGIDASSAYNDVAVAAIVFCVFLFLQIWDSERTWRLLIPIGLLAGYAYAAKYTAALIFVYAVGFVIWRTKHVRPALIVTGCGLLMAMPWALKNWIYAENPVAPFANQIFRNPYVHVSFERDFAIRLRSYDVENKWTLPLEVTVRGAKTAGLLGPVFLLAPLALLALRFREGRRLLFPGLLLLATFPANIGTRFLIPSLPFISLALAIAVRRKWLLAFVVLIHAAASWPDGFDLWHKSYAWRLSDIPYKAALRLIPEEVYLQRDDGYGQARLVEENVPPGRQVFSLGALMDAYTTREVMVGYQAAYNSVLNDIFNSGWGDFWQPTVSVSFRFSEQNIRRLRVVQTASATGSDQWSIAELRILLHGAEIPRRADWRLRAFPNPWDAPLAFDNSPATRWRSWEAAAPGMYMDIDLGRAELTDEVRIETSYDQAQIRMHPEAMDQAGRWIEVPAKAETTAIKPPKWMRLAATREFHRRGVDYLLLQDEAGGASDVLEDPAAWGLKPLARGHGARLYQVIQ